MFQEADSLGLCHLVSGLKMQICLLLILFLLQHSALLPLQACETFFKLDLLK